MDDYALLDSGHGRKLERFGPYTLARPSATAVWPPTLPREAWQEATAAFDREGRNKWTFRQPLPDRWEIGIDRLRFILNLTGFGHLGVFPEQRTSWRWIDEAVRSVSAALGRRARVLNLFAYSGGATLAAAYAGAEVCHLDASKGMTQRARENAALNLLAEAPIRWIVDDVTKFLLREQRRGNRYDGIILDPPSFGRGKAGEVYKIERQITETLNQCRAILADGPAFALFSCHTPAFTPMVMSHLLQCVLPSGGSIESGEMLLTGDENALPLPSGTFSCWVKDLGVDLSHDSAGNPA
jgi:23S rRNA (cytosine1962-C5)-methyltransferase